MNRHHLLGILVAGLLVFSASSAWSSEADKLRERAKAIQRESAELAKQGRKKEAEKLYKEALKLLEAAKRGGTKDRLAPKRTDLDAQIENIEAHVKELRNLLERLRDKAGSKRERAEFKERLLGVEKELHQLQAKRKGGLTGTKRYVKSSNERKYAATIDAATERIRHIVTAAEHLDAAGVHDLAKQLRSKAAIMKKELGEQIRRLKEEASHRHDKRGQGTNAEIVELRQQVKRLQAEIKKLRGNTDRR